MHPLDPTRQNTLRPLPENPGVTLDDVDAREDARLLHAIAGGDERALAAPGLIHLNGLEVGGKGEDVK